MWAICFQFDSTAAGKAIKIALMIDEHARVSLLTDVAVTKAKNRGAFRSGARLDSSTFTTD